MASRAQLVRALQIELRCVQEYSALEETCLPEWVMALIQTHVEVAQHLSGQLWEIYGVPWHQHGPTSLPLSTRTEQKIEEVSGYGDRLPLWGRTTR